MGAKRKLARFLILGASAAGALALPGCAGFERLLPPGFVKYEDLAGDEPPDPRIQERIAERRKEEGRAFPNLSQAPQTRPEPTPEAEREALAAELRAARDALAAAVAHDRELAAEERSERILLPGGENGPLPLDEAGRALQDTVAGDEAIARRERGLPPKPPAREDGQ
ncbi:hypothetical protein [Amphiplicatus metriothermophilus]|nr:hypothetical protein [Amphiplicatus metriothermophilus]MBB5518703.1 hypothetical protein [Amphiplicatus metriothermophilus]